MNKDTPYFFNNKELNNFKDKKDKVAVVKGMLDETKTQAKELIAKAIIGTVK